MTTVWECVPTCPGSGGDLSLDHLAEGALYAAEAAGGVPQTRCYRLWSGNKRRSGLILTCGNNLSGLCQDMKESMAQTRRSPAWLSTVIWRFARTSWSSGKFLELLPSKPPHTLNKISPAGQNWSDFWCFWWCSLPLQSGHWFSACTLNRMAREASKQYVWSYIEEIFQIVFRRNVWAYWKKRYFASMSNLSMFNWSTFRPLVLCWEWRKSVNICI